LSNPDHERPQWAIDRGNSPQLVRGGLKVLPTLVKPLRQNAIKNAALELKQHSNRPRIRASDIVETRVV
jgi:hypothetical protein